MATKDHLPFEVAHSGTLIKDELEVKRQLKIIVLDYKLNTY